MRAVALGDHRSESARDAAVREAVRGTGMCTAGERLWLVGPPQVVEAGNEAFHRLRAIRDAYARAVAVGSADEAPLMERRRKAMAQTRRLVREDLGIGPLRVE
ncbi:hypothetical protein [Streptomyces sp. NRRL F-5123]|uniref:hypothetical protein n=1 Tax=Streptomyces sp. NRRL F-5123 TaxID=1463856 RepID=UPI00099DC2E8|nr:hypothetical protein [Streptomyces sp. NRRL F-5123]